jgi:hypothetical protein
MLMITLMFRVSLWYLGMVTPRFKVALQPITGTHSSGPLTQPKGRAMRFLFRWPSPGSLVPFFGFIFIIIKSYFSLVWIILASPFPSFINHPIYYLSSITSQLLFPYTDLRTPFSLSYSSWETGLLSPWLHSQNIPCNPPPPPCL